MLRQSRLSDDEVKVDEFTAEEVEGLPLQKREELVNQYESREGEPTVDVTIRRRRGRISHVSVLISTFVKNHLKKLRRTKR